MDVRIVPILDDNYAYIIQSGDKVGVIDPGESQKVIEYLEEYRLIPDWIINTHHHGDHTNGNAELLRRFSAKLAAPAECGKADEVLENGKLFYFGDTKFQVILTKGHTAGHVILYDPVYRILFTGDTLFVMGCGRLFEGNAEDMFSAMQFIKMLPPETLIYCGHEYAVENADFAKSVFPESISIFSRASEVETTEQNMPTTLALELKTNPFLIAKTVEEFTKYRELKDSF